jgi:hypothetical protein
VLQVVRLHSDCVTPLAKITNCLLLLDRHALLTIRNLTRSTDGFIECLTMNVITVRRTVFRHANKRSRTRRSFRELTRAYFARENSLEFVVEALFFLIIVAISAWPILAAAGALHEFFQRALT